jgi:endonuclease/exonuclease/phosphatase family metal-dependent hydrolase
MMKKWVKARATHSEMPVSTGISPSTPPTFAPADDRRTAFSFDMPLPPAFAVHTADFRPANRRQPSSSDRTPLRLVQWNIERGYEYDNILATLTTLDADLIALQECDWGCARSGGRDVAGDLARALGLNLAFVTEFEELDSPLRTARDAGGGVHGNAILTKFDISDARAVRHPAAIDWDDGGTLVATGRRHALAAKEPRRGNRVALTAEIKTPAGRLQVYSAHLEVFCGMIDRMAQLASLFDDVRSVDPATPVAILADLNTIAHGIVRLSPHYAHGRARYATLGTSEAEWFAANVVEAHRPRALRAAGASERLIDALRNPGLACPFPATTVTLENRAFVVCGVPLVATKLDWCLLRGVRVEATALANEDYGASDHKALVVNVLVE